VIRISDRFLADLFCEGARTYRVVKDAVPSDAQVVAVQFDFSIAPAQIHMLVESDSFDEVPEGQPWPELDPRMETIAIPDSAGLSTPEYKAAFTAYLRGKPSPEQIRILDVTNGIPTGYGESPIKPLLRSITTNASSDQITIDRGGFVENSPISAERINAAVAIPSDYGVITADERKPVKFREFT
jgi:hypothetical protein